MSANEANETTAQAPNVQMESINRISHLPTVEQTVQVASSIYGAVKDCSSVTNWTLSTAESTAHKAVEISKPIISQFEGPIKKVDGMLCTGLDYVEEKIPAVKLPPGEILFQMYNTTKDYVSSKIQPAVQTAYNIVEPAVEAAKHVVEPYVQPAVSTACAIKDYSCQKVGEILHRNQEPTTTEAKPECEPCSHQGEKSIHSE